MRGGMHGAAVSIAIAATFGCKYHGAAEQDAAPRVGVGFQFPASLTDEGVVTHTVSISLASPSNDTVTVQIEVDGGSADEQDFSLNTQTVTFLPGETRADVDLSITDDGVEEPDETIELKFGDVSNAIVIHDTHTVTISSNILPRVQFVNTTSNDAEEGAAQTFAIEMTIPSPIDVVVGYGVAGTAVGGGVDHDGAPNTITIPSGMTTADLVINVIEDPYDEDPETIDLTLTAQTGAVIGTNTTHIHTIDNDDPPPDVSFVAASSAGEEDAGTSGFVVALSQISGKTVTVSCAVTGGTAAGTDYVVAGCPIQFNPGVPSRTVSVTPVDDTVDEEDETVDISLSAPVNANLGGPATHQFAITDDDTSPTISFSTDSSTTPEDGTGVTLVVSKSEASERVVRFNISINGGSAGSGDYTVGAGPYSIPIGSMSVNVPVTITSDNLDESNETFTLGFTNIVAATAGGTPSHTGTINDDDVGASWTTAGMNPDEGNGSGTNTYNYNVTLDASSAKTVRIDVILGGTASRPGDGSAAPTSLTFTPGDTEETVTVTVVRENDPEPDETIIMTLQSVEYAEIKSPGAVTHTINNDD